MTKDQYNELLDIIEESVQKKLKEAMILKLCDGKLEALGADIISKICEVILAEANKALQKNSPDEDDEGEEDISDILTALEALKNRSKRGDR